MRRVYGDTSFFVALISDTDAHHELARELVVDPRVRVYTSEFVLCEVANYFAKVGRVKFLGFMTSMAAGRFGSITPATSRLYREGLVLYRARPDKDWSLTDCTSFVEMKRLGIRETLTNDHHFEQAGFGMLMK
jgi:uncharacterized protein